MKVVKTKSIPNVDNERLIDSLDQLHTKLHTQQGLYDFDGPRRQLINEGIKAKKIAKELHDRNVATKPCRFCD